MQEIKFDLGQNIVSIAAASGVPKFRVRDLAGGITYSVTNVPPATAAHFTRPGYEVVWGDIFSFRMYADRKWSEELVVDSVALMSRIDLFKDEDALSFASRTIAQFQRGKWQRYADPDFDILLTGRSSFLDERGNVSAAATGAMDPAAHLSLEDWRALMKGGGPTWWWVGDGVIAKLGVTYSQSSDSRIAPYSFDLGFDLQRIFERRQAEDLARELKEGDAKGWNSTADHEARKKAAKERHKVLAAKAVERGDKVIAFPAGD